MNCRLCGATLTRTFLDLGDMPLANGYLDSPDQPEERYPLHARVCDGCMLVQTDAVVPPEDLFSEYAFFSSYSPPWIDHCRHYVKEVMDRFDPRWVVEVASNDGSLLAQFPDSVNVLGIEPAKNVAAVARSNGVTTISEFFGAANANDFTPKADLLIANNVLGHVPDVNDFIEGLAIQLAPEGVLTVETPSLVSTISENQFDQIYHEHHQFWSLTSAERAFARHGLRVFDVEFLPVHGTSMRLFLCHAGAHHEQTWAVRRAQACEIAHGMGYAGGRPYRLFSVGIDRTLGDLRRFFEMSHADGKTIAGAGAPAKGNTLLNAAGVAPAFVTDTSPHKVGKFLPGTHVPIFTPEAMAEHRPDFVLILAWNWLDEIMASMPEVRGWGGRFVAPIPRLRVVG